MSKDTKGNHSTTSEDSLELRIKELEEELATATHCWKECSERLDWLEDRMAPENAGKSFVIELCDDYRDRFFEIKEDYIHKSSGRSRPAKTARIKREDTESAKEMAERLGMELPDKEEQMANLNRNLREIDK